MSRGVVSGDGGAARRGLMDVIWAFRKIKSIPPTCALLSAPGLFERSCIIAAEGHDDVAFLGSVPSTPLLPKSSCLAQERVPNRHSPAFRAQRTILRNVH